MKNVLLSNSSLSVFNDTIPRRLSNDFYWFQHLQILIKKVWWEWEMQNTCNNEYVDHIHEISINTSVDWIASCFEMLIGLSLQQVFVWIFWLLRFKICPCCSMGLPDWRYWLKQVLSITSKKSSLKSSSDVAGSGTEGALIALCGTLVLDISKLSEQILCLFSVT